jgi:hypothetical protein
MGWSKDAKAATAGQHAARSAEEGHSVLVYRQNVPFSSAGWSGPVSAAAEVIEAIEDNGWSLATLAYDEQQTRNGAMLLLFRRGSNNRDTS